MGTEYYTLCCIQWIYQIHFIMRTKISSGEYTWLQSIVHSQRSWPTVPIKFSTFCQVHSRACCEWGSQSHSMSHMLSAWPHAPKEAHMRISSILLSILSNTLQITLNDNPRLHDYTLARCNMGGIDFKTDWTRSIPSQYPLILSHYRIRYWTYTRTNWLLTLKNHSGTESNQNWIYVEKLSNPNILFRLVRRCEKVALFISVESRDFYTSFLYALPANSNYRFL
jgi:hypothetical protein